MNLNLRQSVSDSESARDDVTCLLLGVASRREALLNLARRLTAGGATGFWSLRKPLKNRFSELLAASRNFWNRLGAAGIDLGCQGMVLAA